MKQYIKLTKLDGFDFHTGKTINYRANIGKIVHCPNKEGSKLCSDNVIHASDYFFQALNYAELPCSIFIINGNPISSQDDKHGFKSFKVVKEVNMKNWNNAYYKIMKYMLEDTKKNFDNKKYDHIIKALDQVIGVFNNTLETGKIDRSAAMSAWSAAESIRSAMSTWSAAESIRSARSAAMSAAESIRSAAMSAWSAAEAARSAMSAAESRGAHAMSAWSAAEAARSAAMSAAWSAMSAAESIRSAAKNKKLKEYSDKFLEYLEKDNKIVRYHPETKKD